MIEIIMQFPPHKSEFQTFAVLRIFYSFCWDFLASEFSVPMLGTLGLVFIGHLNKETIWEEMVGVFIQVKVWLKRSVCQLVGRWDGVGRRHDLVEEWGMDGNSPKLEPVLKRMLGRNSPRSEQGKGAIGMAVI
jgi:hypothetical protein